MRKEFIKIWNKARTLKIDILTFFLSLICISFLAVITSTRSKNYKTILEFSKEVAEQSSAIVSQKFQDIALASERVAKIAAGFFPELVPFTLQNEPMITYLSNVIKYNKNFSNYYIGLTNGGFIGVMSLEFADQKTYISDPLKPLPKNARFILRYVDWSVNPPTDTWYYQDEEFKTISQEEVKNLNYDSRKRPWYIGAVEAGSLYWTGFYPFLPNVGKGISIGNPIFAPSATQGNPSGVNKKDLIGVIGIDLTMIFLDEFVKNQQIGIHGKVFILNNKGKIIVPTTADVDVSSAVDAGLVGMLFQQYSNNPVKPDIIADYRGVEYLSYTSKLPEVFSGNWYIMAVAPSDDFFSGLISAQHRVFLLIGGILILSALIVIYFAKKVSSPIKKLASEVDKIRQLELESETRISSQIDEIQQIDTAIASMRRVIRSFCKYVPKEIVKDLIDNNEEIALGGKKKEVTIFVSDINNFTTIAEALPIDHLTALLGEYFDALSKIILESHGTIDKFIGDGIMAFWGAPIEFEDHVERACITALRCHALTDSLNQKRSALQQPVFFTRFGIHTGTVIVGNIGTEERMNYTAIGNAVNISNRLQAESKHYQVAVIISQETREILGDNFVVRPLDLIVLKEKKEKVLIYELAGVINGAHEIQASKEKRELCRNFTTAFEAMQSGNLEGAYTLFSEIAKNHPDDYPTQVHLKRIKEGK
ncbi:MAG: hypothetical protein KF898_07710 [Parachlamydiales bacterium]|nr:hypothetical protein [Candidatus Acheromyda pituitae]